MNLFKFDIAKLLKPAKNVLERVFDKELAQRQRELKGIELRLATIRAETADHALGAMRAKDGFRAELRKVQLEAKRVELEERIERLRKAKEIRLHVAEQRQQTKEGRLNQALRRKALRKLLNTMTDQEFKELALSNGQRFGELIMLDADLPEDFRSSHPDSSGPIFVASVPAPTNSPNERAQ